MPWDSEPVIRGCAANCVRAASIQKGEMDFFLSGNIILPHLLKVGSRASSVYAATMHACQESVPPQSPITSGINVYKLLLTTDLGVNLLGVRPRTWTSVSRALW